MVSRSVSVTDFFEIVSIVDVICRSIWREFWFNCCTEMEFGKGIEKEENDPGTCESLKREDLRSKTLRNKHCIKHAQSA